MENLKYKPYPCLRVVCSSCGFEIHTKGKLDTNCIHPAEKQRYKIVVVVSKTGKRKTLTLSTRNFIEATNEVLKFKKILENPIIEQLLPKDGAPNLLIDTMRMYIDYLSGHSKLYQQKTSHSKGYVGDTKRYLQEFKSFLKNELKLNLDSLSVDFVNENIVSKYCEYIEKIGKDKSIRTLQKYVTTVRTFYNYLIEIKKYDLKNYFIKVNIIGINRENKVEPATEPVSLTTLEDIIPKINRENGWKTFETGNKRNMFRPYLPQGYLLLALSGRRLLEACNIRFSDVKYDRNLGKGYIVVKDRKSTQLSKTKETKYVFVPITKQLLALLIELGYNQYKETDRYIIANDEKSDRKTVAKNLSKGFSHFVKCINSEKHLMLKGLRKNYISKLNNHNKGGGIKTEDITGHSSFGVIEAHYLDKAEKSLSISKSEFEI